MYRLVKIAAQCGAITIGCVSVLSFLFTVPLFAQHMPFSGISTGGLGGSPGVSWTGPRNGVPLGAHRLIPRRGGAVPIFFGGDYFGADYGYESVPPIVINNVVPEPDAQTKKRALEEYTPAAPLIIEREGDQWVRRRVSSTAPGQTSPQTVSETQPLPQKPPQPLPAMTLVFRDGHQEQITSYMIFGGALYHSTPAWAPQQRILLSALDLEATSSANRQRGLDFRLPNSPTEVVVRP